jgi:hypothetical protein
MKRTLWIAAIVVALIAVAALPAAAEGDKNRYRRLGNVFGLVGEGTAVDADAGTITIEVMSGSKLVKVAMNIEVTLTTNDDTRFIQYIGPECEEAAFEDVEIGDFISANGLVLTEGDTTVFLASRVTIDIPLDCQL